MGPPSYMRSVVDLNVVMRGIPVIMFHPCRKVPCLLFTLLPFLFFISLFISKFAHLFLTVPYQYRAECEVNGIFIVHS